MPSEPNNSRDVFPLAPLSWVLLPYLCFRKEVHAYFPCHQWCHVPLAHLVLPRAVTAADGAEQAYSRDGNKARTETPAQALASDVALGTPELA